ncbi:hypothetical protein N0V88_006235 [Collariella sp. IMI 366227]|nr:hypothetical protein N0V88_006235 [Collariella sp. IMI 366227]
MPKAATFLWNQKMMIQITCRGYATAQFMQPEPAKYAQAPNIEAKTFMQPEQNYYAHHPGRFVYIKDLDTRNLFSAPHEPVRAPPERFVFSAGKSNVSWVVERSGIRVEMVMSLPTDDVAELWTIRVSNISGTPRRIAVTPYFPTGYMSWMNQSAEWNADLVGVVASSVTPYQKADDYFKNKYLKDKTYFLCETLPDSWEASQQAFEGEGGLHNPSALEGEKLSNSDARYETPTAAVQYRTELEAGQSREYRFMFGPAYDEAEIQTMRERYLSKKAFEQTAKDYAEYMERGRGCLRIETPDKELDNFVNNWLPRQVYYHGNVNRLTTDPQTRNYLQDNMGMNYINPEVARAPFITALSQQEPNGAMPDGILLAEGAELKYINQIPHTDHCVWLPIALDVYLSETNDYALLDEPIRTSDGTTLTVFERLTRAMDFLLSIRDPRGLSYIAQGDWCDPMNMVGYLGRGVSGWLTLATAYALKLFANICTQTNHPSLATHFYTAATTCNTSANTHLWHTSWFARGITDAGTIFGVASDPEGRIWLNPQAFALLSGAASPAQTAAILPQIDEHLATPYGVQMFGPPYTSMREDIGRVTQKAPGSAENASVYNHAAAFYIYALYTTQDGNQADRAYRHLRQMIPGPGGEDYLQRGQLPVFIPNYYRGAWREGPRTAGRSSGLFWEGMRVVRVFRGQRLRS